MVCAPGWLGAACPPGPHLWRQLLQQPGRCTAGRSTVKTSQAPSAISRCALFSVRLPQRTRVQHRWSGALLLLPTLPAQASGSSGSRLASRRRCGARSLPMRASWSSPTACQPSRLAAAAPNRCRPPSRLSSLHRAAARGQQGQVQTLPAHVRWLGRSSSSGRSWLPPRWQALPRACPC